MPNRLLAYVPATVIFPELDASFASFTAILRKLSRTDTLLWCGRLNTVVSGSSDLDHLARQRFGVEVFFGPSELDALNRFVNSRGPAAKSGIFFRGQLLELIRWVALHCEDKPGDGATFDDPDTRRHFLQAALIASDIWGKRVYGDRLTRGETAGDRIKNALGAVRKGIEGSVEGNALATDLNRFLGRGWLLFQNYLPKRYVNFPSEFLDATGFTIEEYYACLTSILVNYLSAEAGRYIFDVHTFAGATASPSTLMRFVMHESQTGTELRAGLWPAAALDIRPPEEASYDYRSLRERPFFRADDGRTAMLDPMFVYDRASIGPLFAVANRLSGSNANRLFESFGKAFEDYCNDAWQRIYLTSPWLASRLTLGLKVGRFEIDACLNDVTSISVIEEKAVFIREGDILGQDPESLVRVLLEKYGVSEDSSGKKRVRGVGQLARSIRAISQDGWLEDHPAFQQATVIYPILLVHDYLLGAVLESGFLAAEFLRLVGPRDSHGSLWSGRFRVAPLTLMTVDDLETLESSLENFGLRELLEDYTTAIGREWMSLHDFLAVSKYGKKTIHNRYLAAQCIEVLERTDGLLRVVPHTEATS